MIFLLFYCIFVNAPTNTNIISHTLCEAELFCFIKFLLFVKLVEKKGSLPDNTNIGLLILAENRLCQSGNYMAEVGHPCEKQKKSEPNIVQPLKCDQCHTWCAQVWQGSHSGQNSHAHMMEDVNAARA